MANYLYGFHNLQDLRANRVSEVGVEVINTAVEQAVTEHNRQVDALARFFVVPTQNFKTRFNSVTAARLQPLDEAGRARPIKPTGQYDVSYPLQMAGTAWGYDYVTGKKLTVGEVERITSAMVAADARWMRDHILAALFTNADWTFTDPLHGALTIKGLANGDSQVYQVLSGGDIGTTANNFVAQSAGIADVTNPFPGIYSKLIQHPENGGEAVAFVPTNLIASVQGLADFKPVSDPNIREGSNSDVLIGTLSDELPGVLVGYVDKVWIVEWRGLPDNYIIAVTTGGDKALAMREDPEASLRGFQKVADRDDHPWYERQYLRRAGFGAWNRVGAVVARIGNASYAIPTNYSSPMG